MNVFISGKVVKCPYHHNPHISELTAVARKSSADTARDYGNLARVSPGSSTANMAAVAGSLARVSPGLQQARCDSPQTSAPAPALPPRSVHGAAESVAGVRQKRLCNIKS